MAEYNHLLRVHWERPRKIAIWGENPFDGPCGYTEEIKTGVLPIKCHDHMIEELIANQHKSCEDEDIGRKITKVEIYTLHNIITY